MNSRVYFLDGLRGWGALMVVLSHTLQCWLLNPNGMKSSGNSIVLAAINFSPLGIAMDGALAVHIFFTLSGFALSYPVLVSQNRTRTLLNMAAFRYPRLAIPVLMSSLFTFALWGALANVEADKLSNSGWLASFYGFAPTWTGLLRFSIHDAFFAYANATTWNAALWTMPVEMAGSFIMFAFLFAVPVRLLRLILAVGFASYNRESSLCCFAIGYLIAELLYISGRRSDRVGAGIFFVALIAAIWMRANDIAATFALNLTAGLIVSAVAISARLQNAFSNSASRFLGKISFSLYLVHLPIICSLGSWLYILVAPAAGFLGAAAIVCPAVVATSLVAAMAFNWVVEERMLPPIKQMTASIVAAIRDTLIVFAAKIALAHRRQVKNNPRASEL